MLSRRDQQHARKADGDIGKPLGSDHQTNDANPFEHGLHKQPQWCRSGECFKEIAVDTDRAGIGSHRKRKELNEKFKRQINIYFS